MPLLLVLLNFPDIFHRLSDDWLLLKGCVCCVGICGGGGEWEERKRLEMQIILKNSADI